MSLFTMFSPGAQLENAIRTYTNYAIRDAALKVIEKEVDEYRRVVAKKVWKAVDSFIIEQMSTMSPRDLKTHVHFIFKDKKDEAN